MKIKYLLIMKNFFTILFILTLFISSNAQQAFQTTFPFYKGNGDVVITQPDGYILSGICFKGRYYMYLLKTNLDGDTLWTKEVDMGQIDNGEVKGTSDDEGNFYLTTYNILKKFDPTGNIIWSRSFTKNITNLAYSNNNLWLTSDAITYTGEYLYKISALTGDSLWRSNKFSPDFSTISRCTSLHVDTADNVLMAVSSINTYTYWLDESTLFYYQNNSDSVVNIPFNTGEDIVILKTIKINNDYYSIGPKKMESNTHKQYLLKYNSNGEILQINEIPLPYYMSFVESMVLNMQNKIVLLFQVIETEHSNTKVLLHGFSLNGDSLWTSINGLPGDITAYNIYLTGDGGYAICGSMLSNPYNSPYLLKTNSMGLITGIETHSLENQTPIAYPNPTSQFIKLETGKFIGATITVYSMNNEVIHEDIINSSTCQLSVAGLQKGTYIYRISKKGKSFAGKFIIL
jgi:hypothetical protein